MHRHCKIIGEMNMGSGMLSGATSSAGPVNLICDDSFEDACSICLEPFTSADAPSVTKCKHEYHLHCILEWSQRRIECPICSQHLVLEDPASQKLLAEVESDQNLRLSKSNPANQENEINNDVPHTDESDLEHRIMQHFAAIATTTRSISRRRRQVTPVSPSQILPSVNLTNTSNVTQVHGSSPEHQNIATCFEDSDSSPPARVPSVTRPSSSTIFLPVGELPSNNGRSSSSEFAAFSQSVKSKVSTASARYKELISKSTHGLKEKIIARNDSVKELSRGVQRDMSAGIAGISRMIHHLDITQKLAGFSAPLSSYAVKTPNSPHELKRH